MLANEGYTVLHMTRHCGMEHGKDVLAISPSGEVCAYQLKGTKGGKIKLKHYQEELLSQIMQLVHTPVSHPSVPSPNQHKSFFVTNGEMEEEVFREIDSFNKNWVLQGQPQYQLHTIVKGQLFDKAMRLQTDFIPTELTDFRSLIDFYLNDGEGILDKGKFSDLLQGHFKKEINGKTEAKRIISSGALLCSLATTSYTNKNNHVAIVEAWAVFTSYLLLFGETNKLEHSLYQSELAIAEEIIKNALEDLLEEVLTIKDLLQGSVAEDAYLYQFRVAWLLGFLSYLGLYYRIKRPEKENPNVETITKFIEANDSNQKLWGEAGTPCFIMQHFFKMVYHHGNATDVLRSLVDAILEAASTPDIPFTSPYEDIDTSLSLLFIDDRSEKGVYLLENESYHLWSIIMLLVSINDKDFLKSRWKKITSFRFKAFQPADALDLYLWRSKPGRDVTNLPNVPERWDNLVAQVLVHEPSIPKTLRETPWFFPLFLLVFPHRLNKDFALYLKSNLLQAP